MMPDIHDEASKSGWKIVDWLFGASYCNREIAASDTVYPSVTDLRAFNYSPDFLPDGCTVLDENDLRRASNIATIA